MGRLRRIAGDPLGKVFLVGLLMLALGLLYVLIYLIFNIDLYRLTPLYGRPCHFQQLTGLYCPGCGCTRSLLALSRGNPVTSVYYHPLPLYVVLLYLNFMIRYIFSALVPEEFPIRLKPARYRLLYVILLAVLLIGNWILRNVLLINGISTL